MWKNSRAKLNNVLFIINEIWPFSVNLLVSMGNVDVHPLAKLSKRCKLKGVKKKHDKPKFK